MTIDIIAKLPGPPTRDNLTGVNFRSVSTSKCRGNNCQLSNVDLREQKVVSGGDFGGAVSQKVAQSSCSWPSSPQVWHVGVKGNSSLELRDYVSVKRILWPYDSDSSSKFGYSLIRENRVASNPGVLFVRGGRLNHGDKNRGVMQSVIGGWFRTSWPVVVYVKNHIGDIHDNLRDIFSEVGSGGHWFPVCSSISPFGVHDRGGVYANVFGLQHQYIECSEGSAAKKYEKGWNRIIVGSIIKRICSVHIACFVQPEDRHRHQDRNISNRPAEESAGSATNELQRPRGIEQAGVGGEQLDQNIQSSALRVVAGEAPLAESDLMAPALPEAGSNAGDFGGGTCSRTQAQCLPTGGGNASSGDGHPSMHPDTFIGP